MITVWHILSVICLITATASANGTAKSQHAGAVAYMACILVGILLGLIAAYGNFSTATLARRAVQDQAQIGKIMIPILTLLVGVGWIALADLSGRWVSLAVLHVFLRQ
jgi:hypothetical protein